MRLKGNYYDLANSKNEYFVTDIGNSVDENVNFIYSTDWPTRVEIYGDRVAEPVGLQEGLGILGFCYVPYHLVYDVDFPVLIQFWDSEEIFQFPMAVVIQKNQAREALAGEAGYSIESPVCDYPNQNVHVTTYDTNLNPVEARIRFKCLTSECSIGNTVEQNGEAFLDALMPSCVNGFVMASAEGFVNSKTMVSTTEESYVDIIMSRLYKIPIELNSGSKKALVSFKSDEHSTTIMYPDTSEVELSEGYYNVSVFVYGDSGLKFPATSENKCVTVPQQGIGGLLGLEEEKCFDINIPEYDIDFSIIGGGHVAEYFTEGMLTDSEKLKITAKAVSTPKNINELQENYIEVENSILGVSFV